MPEYGLTIPLWDTDGPVEEQGRSENPLSLSAPLLHRLAEVQKAWDRLVDDVADDHHDGERGERSGAYDVIDEEELSGRLALRDLSLAVMNDLAQELGPEWRIQLRL